MTTNTTATRYEVRCPICNRWRCAIRLSIRGNPYYTCPDCGVRVFVNGPKGKQRLMDMATEVEDA